MDGIQHERLTRAAEVTAIAALHLVAGWTALHLSAQRANWLLDHAEAHNFEWKIQRYGK